MKDTKHAILELQDELIGMLNANDGNFRSRVEKVKTKIADSILQAKERKDGMTQLYGCMAEAYLNTFAGEKDELIEGLSAFTKTDTQFIFAKEKGTTYPPSTLLIDADTYGLYYALNDHYSKQWDSRAYKLSKNGSEGNPLITNLFKYFYVNDKGKPLYHINSQGYADIAGKYESDMDNTMGAELEKTFKKYRTTIFPDMTCAYVGAAGITYDKIILPLARQFAPASFLNYSPDMNGAPLTLATADHLINHHSLLVDYVVSSNVLNCFSHQAEGAKRDEIMAASAKILKKGGKAIHLMEKTNYQRHLNVNLNKSVHKMLGEDLIYSFHRDKGNMDLDMDRRIPELKPDNYYEQGLALDDEGGVLHTEVASTRNTPGSTKGSEIAAALAAQQIGDKPNDFATTMLVLNQTSKPLINENTVNKLRASMNQYQGRFNYYHKPVYVEKPGMGLE